MTNHNMTPAPATPAREIHAPDATRYYARDGKRVPEFAVPAARAYGMTIYEVSEPIVTDIIDAADYADYYEGQGLTEWSTP